MTRCDDLAKTINGSFDFPAGALDNRLPSWDETASGHLFADASNKGVLLGTASASATEHLLDDYEEGTWTPTYSATSLSVSSYDRQVGRFVRVGHMVWVYGAIATNVIASQGASGADLKISGLPFTTENVNHTQCCLNISQTSNWQADNHPKAGIFLRNIATIQLVNFFSSDPRDAFIQGMDASIMTTTSIGNLIEFSGHYRTA